jgi:hypothetical protein
MLDCLCFEIKERRGEVRFGAPAARRQSGQGKGGATRLQPFRCRITKVYDEGTRKRLDSSLNRVAHPNVQETSQIHPSRCPKSNLSIRCESRNLKTKIRDTSSIKLPLLQTTLKPFFRSSTPHHGFEYSSFGVFLRQLRTFLLVSLVM